MSGVPVAQAFVKLCELPQGSTALVEAVDDASPGDKVALRLRDLGFVHGEPVRLVGRGPIGADPLLVQIGYTRFALRRSEAARVRVKPSQLPGQPPSGNAPHGVNAA